MLKESWRFLGKNLRYAKAVSRTAAGSSFVRWGMVGAGIGGVYGAADGLTGNDRTSIVQGAFRGGMIGMGARGLFGGFKGLKPHGTKMGTGGSMYNKARGLAGDAAIRSSINKQIPIADSGSGIAPGVRSMLRGRTRMIGSSGTVRQHLAKMNFPTVPSMLDDIAPGLSARTVMPSAGPLGPIPNKQQRFAWGWLNRHSPRG